jgi:hypothetical protein
MQYRGVAILLAVLAIPAAGQQRVQLAMATPPVPEIPAQASDGRFLTINHGIGDQQALWHVRAALNVAALGCNSDQEQLAAAYNQFLHEQRDQLAAADASVRRDFQKRYGTGWRVQHDLYMTRLYNFFSQPFVHTAFCSAASAYVADAGAPRSEIEAPVALARLEAPFTDFFRRYVAYRDGLTAMPRLELVLPGDVPMPAARARSRHHSRRGAAAVLPYDLAL